MIVGMQALTIAASVSANCCVFNPPGILAIHPHAIGASYEAIAPQNAAEAPKASPLAVVSIRGPLMHHTGKFDSYDAIKMRVRAALDIDAVRYVLLSIDSPGGLLAGCLDCVQELRAMALAAGKRLFTYIDSMAASAAYALALAGERIYVPKTGIVGSVGIIEDLADMSEADAKMGVKHHVIYSGARKADQNPHVVKSEAMVQAFQSEVDYMASLFFDTVAEYRPSLKSESVRNLQAGTLVGQQAIDAGLADVLMTEDEVVALLSSPQFEASLTQPPAEAPKKEGSKSMGFAEAMSAIQAVVDDANSTDEEKATARKMIAACNSAPKAAEGEPPPKKEGEEPPPKKEEPDGDEGKNAMISATNKAIDAARSALLATRGDFTPEQVKTLRGAELSLVEDAVRNWPRNAPGPVAQAVAALGVVPQTQPAKPEATDPTKEPMTEQAQALMANLMANSTDVPKMFKDAEGYHCVRAITPKEQSDYMSRRFGL